MKTIAKYLTILSASLLISLALTGQKTLLLQDIQPLMALASDIKYDVGISAEYNSDTYQFYMEDIVQFKNWMVSSSHWETEGNISEDRDLVMEDWMVQPFAPGKEILIELIKEEQELPLQLDHWMIHCADWKIAGL